MQWGQKQLGTGPWKKPYGAGKYSAEDQAGFCFVFTFNGGIIDEDSILYFTKYLRQEDVCDYMMLV